MTLLIIIVVALALQLTGYILTDKYNFSRWLKTCILLVALVFHAYLLPNTMISNLYSANPDLRCGVPATGILLISWIFGAILTLFEFGIYELVLWRRRKNGALKAL